MATPPGRGALAIIRLSGPAVLSIASQLIPEALPLRARYAHRAKIFDGVGGIIDDGIALYFAAPASATGEDVLELHLHGSPLIAEHVITAVLAAGARLAGPGEFTRRAFLNGKLDLSAAEAVADLIAAESRSAARAAVAALAGDIARTVLDVSEMLRNLIEELSAAIDFPDEVPDPERADVTRRITGALAALQPLIEGGTLGQIAREGAQVAIVGPPNAGKSSLLNALLGANRVIVSPIAGTTRDTVEEAFEIDGLLVRLIDTAGIRTEADQLEAAGIERTQAVLEAARLALVVVDGADVLSPEAWAVLEQTRERERIILFNKADLGNRGFRQWIAGEGMVLHGSVHEPATLERVKSALREVLVGSSSRIDLERPALARSRERDAAYQAQAALLAARETLALGEALDLLVGDLTAAIAALGQITGATVDEETLDGIFARFCIGK